MDIYTTGIVISIIVRAMSKAMQKNDVEKTLETFVCNLVRMALLIVVVVLLLSPGGLSRQAKLREV